MKIHIYKVRDINEYWERLDKDLDISILHMLRDRYEYGTGEMCSEAGIQQSLAHYATKIAQNEGLDIVKTRCICQAVGLCFPEHGSVGLKIIKEYLSDKNYDGIDINNLEIDTIEKKISDGGIPVTKELDDVLHMYFNGVGEDAEVNVARYCHIKLQSAREIMKKGIFAGEAITSIMEKAVTEYDRRKQYSFETTYCPIPEDVRLDMQNNVKKAFDWGGIEALYSYVL